MKPKPQSRAGDERRSRGGRGGAASAGRRKRNGGSGTAAAEPRSLIAALPASPCRTRASVLALQRGRHSLTAAGPASFLRRGAGVLSPRRGRRPFAAAGRTFLPCRRAGILSMPWGRHPCAVRPVATVATVDVEPEGAAAAHEVEEAAAAAANVDQEASDARDLEATAAAADMNPELRRQSHAGGGGAGDQQFRLSRGAGAGELWNRRRGAVISAPECLRRGDGGRAAEAERRRKSRSGGHGCDRVKYGEGQGEWARPRWRSRQVRSQRRPW